MPDKLTECQKSALPILEGSSNVFLTGVPGSGKSYLIRYFLEKKSLKDYPILASTGAAAILVGGRTFHGFFGLGIGEGGCTATVERALKNRRLVKRLRKTKCVIVDEVSMLSGASLQMANIIAKRAREDRRPWGGLRVITVGDFAQLPPVNPFGGRKDWAFLSPVWQETGFVPAVLKTIMRTGDAVLLEVLSHLREGTVNEMVSRFLDARLDSGTSDFEGTYLFPRRQSVESYNLQRLSALSGKSYCFATKYHCAGPFLDMMKKNAPVSEVIQLKKNAWVMLRSNDPTGRWVNGSLGTIKDLQQDRIGIRLRSGREVSVERTKFTLLNADGTEVASCENFPVNLAYASTIHKVQGMTLDRAMMDLRNLWEPGHAYVALSRVKDSDGIFLSGWTPQSIRVDPAVCDYYRALESKERDAVAEGIQDS